MPFLTDALLSYYDNAFASAIATPEQYDKVESRLTEYLTKINSGKMVRSMWSTFKPPSVFNRTGMSYLVFCFQESVSEELKNKIIPDLISLSETWPDILPLEATLKPADPNRTGTAPIGFEGGGYYGVAHYDITLLRGTEQVHSEFWEFLSGRLSGLG